MLYETFREAIGNLVASAQRSFLALLGIVIGAGAVIAMLNVGSIAHNETVKQFREMGTDLLAIQVSGAVAPGELGAGIADSVPAALASISIIAPLAIGGGSIAFRGRSANTTHVATTPSFARLAR